MEDKSSGDQPIPAPSKAEVPAPPAGSRKNNGIFEAVWKFFSSVHLAVIVLIILASISIIGTVLAQGDSAADNVQLFENWIVGILDTFGVVDQNDPASVSAHHDRIHLAAERLYRFSLRVGFTDLYHTWYFNLLLGLLSLNLLVCSLQRWPVTWRLIARPRLALDDAGFKGSPFRDSHTLRIVPDAAAEIMVKVLKKAGFSPRVTKTDGAVHFFGQKGWYSRLGVYTTHLSIIVIFIGGIIGVMQGFKGYMQIVEGSAEKSFYQRGTQKKLILPFEVRCDNFEVEYYPDGVRPKDYFSDLTVIQDGKEVVKRRIEVNSPLKYDGIFFYQSSYGETGQGLKTDIRITDPATGLVRVENFGRALRTLPEFNNIGIQVMQAVPDFATDPERGVYSKSNTPNNPAVSVRVELPDGTKRQTWLFARYPDTQLVKDLPVQLSLLGFAGLQYTGLQVVYDPGVWVIWLGCSIMVVGLMVSFFVSHRRVWLRLDGEGDKTTVRLAGRASKNREAFRDEFKQLSEKVAASADRKKS